MCRVLTGESVPVDIVVGSRVTGTTVNLTGRLVVRLVGSARNRPLLK